MKLFLKLTDNVIKQNLRQLVLFTFLYRLVAGIFYVKTVNGILRFSLHMAGYSYLTIGNLRAFLLHPFTIPFVIFILLLGMIFLLIETGAMVTAYHSSIYLRKISSPSMGRSKMVYSLAANLPEASVVCLRRMYPAVSSSLTAERIASLLSRLI